MGVIVVRQAPVATPVKEVTIKGSTKYVTAKKRYKGVNDQIAFTGVISTAQNLNLNPDEVIEFGKALIELANNVKSGAVK